MCCVLATAATISYKKEFLFIEQKNRSKIWRIQQSTQILASSYFVFFFSEKFNLNYSIRFILFNTHKMCVCVSMGTGGDHFSFICVINKLLTFVWKYFYSVWISFVCCICSVRVRVAFFSSLAVCVGITLPYGKFLFILSDCFSGCHRKEKKQILSPRKTRETEIKSPIKSKCASVCDSNFERMWIK